MFELVGILLYIDLGFNNFNFVIKIEKGFKFFGGVLGALIFYFCLYVLMIGSILLPIFWICEWVDKFKSKKT